VVRELLPAGREERVTRILFLILVALLAVTAVSGCRRHARPDELGLRTGRINERRLQNLVEEASRATGCPAAALQRQELGRGVYEIAGCNMVRHYAMPCRNRYSCRWEAIAPIESQVPAYFQCAPPAVWIQPTNDPLTRVVTACDRQAHFQLRCAELECGWFQVGNAWAAPGPALPDAYQAAPPAEAASPAQGAPPAGEPPPPPPPESGSELPPPA